MSITQPDYVFVTLGIQSARRMSHVVIVACPALHYFSTLSHKRHDFRKQVIEHKRCVSSFSTTFVRNIFHSKKNTAIYDRKSVVVFM